MRALVEQAGGYEVVLVASNRPHAPGLDWVRKRGLPTWTCDSRSMERARFDLLLAGALDDHRVGTIALAGYMRILTTTFIHRFAGRIVNIHPSLLPKYRGLDTHRRVLDAGDAVSGCSVHLVTEELDSGAIFGQTNVPVKPGDTAQSLSERVLAAEHILYPKILREFVEQ